MLQVSKKYFPFTFRNKKKEEFLKQKTKQKIQEKKKEINEQEEKEEQDKRALEEYDKWLVNIISYYESLKYFSTKKSSKKEAQGRHK